MEDVLTAPISWVLVAGDGFTDLLLRTPQGLYCWRQHPRPGALPLAFLLGFLVLGAAFAFATQAAQGGGGGRARRGQGGAWKRSTDA